MLRCAVPLLKNFHTTFFAIFAVHFYDLWHIKRKSKNRQSVDLLNCMTWIYFLNLIQFRLIEFQILKCPRIEWRSCDGDSLYYIKLQDNHIYI